MSENTEINLKSLATRLLSSIWEIFKAKPLANCYIVNQVPRPIFLTAESDFKVIPPFGKLRVSKEEFDKCAIEKWESAGVVTREVEAIPEILGMLWTGLIILGASYAVSIFMAAPKILEKPLGYTLALVAITTFIYTAIDIYKNDRLSGFIQTIKHAIGILVQLLIAFGIPAVVILGIPMFGQSPSSTDTLAGSVSYAAEIGPKLQVLLIGILSGLPALMFYLFDRQRLSTLKDEFYRAVVLLVPAIHTISDAKSVYGLKADSFLGNSGSNGKSARFLNNNRIIIYITTILITVGWTVTLANKGPVSGTTLTDYLIPTEQPLVYAFLGAYTFGIGLLFRRYARADIKPSAYAHFTVRTISSIIIAWVVALVLKETFSPSQILACAFVIGIFPNTGIRAMMETVGKILPKSQENTMAEKYPLSLLDGVNIYHRTRLIDEGIENLETLAHSDLISLMLQTRIPLSTLVDWIDQAILYLQISKDSGDNADFLTLRAYGIRTASDLIMAASKSESNPLFLNILDKEGATHRLKTIIDTLRGDKWLENIQAWRKNRFPTDPVMDPMDVYNEQVYIELRDKIDSLKQTSQPYLEASNS